MNYLKELNAFHEWLDTNPLDSGAIVLWYTLMAVNNKTNWKDEFTVANLALQAKTGLSRQQLDRARTNLINSERILYKKSGRVNKAGSYSMVSFDTQDGHRVIHEPDTNRTQSGHAVTTLVKHKHKQNETKEDDKARESNPFQFFEEEGFGTLSATIGEKLGKLIDEFGETRVIAAMKEAVIYGGRNLAYVTRILTNPNSTKPKGANTHGKSGGTPQKSNDDSGVDW